jgi:hypothetical protein
VSLLRNNLHSSTKNENKRICCRLLFKENVKPFADPSGGVENKNDIAVVKHQTPHP